MIMETDRLSASWKFRKPAVYFQSTPKAYKPREPMVYVPVGVSRVMAKEKMSLLLEREHTGPSSVSLLRPSVNEIRGPQDWSVAC